MVDTVPRDAPLRSRSAATSDWLFQDAVAEAKLGPVVRRTQAGTPSFSVSQAPPPVGVPFTKPYKPEVRPGAAAIPSASIARSQSRVTAFGAPADATVSGFRTKQYFPSSTRVSAGPRCRPRGSRRSTASFGSPPALAAAITG